MCCVMLFTLHNNNSSSGSGSGSYEMRNIFPLKSMRWQFFLKIHLAVLVFSRITTNKFQKFSKIFFSYIYSLTLSWLLFLGCFIPSVEWWLILFVISLEQAPKALLTIYNIFFYILFINISLTGGLGFIDKTSKLLQHWLCSWHNKRWQCVKGDWHEIN